MRDPFEIILGAGSIILAGIGVLGQADMLDIGHSWVTQYGGLGLAVWLVIHNTVKTIPGMQADHRAERAEFQKQMAEERRSHSAEMERQRNEFAELLGKSQCRWEREHRG